MLEIPWSQGIHPAQTFILELIAQTHLNQLETTMKQMQKNTPTQIQELNFTSFENFFIYCNQFEPHAKCRGVCVFDSTYYKITTTNYISKTSLYTTLLGSFWGNLFSLFQSFFFLRILTFFEKRNGPNHQIQKK